MSAKTTATDFLNNAVFASIRERADRHRIEASMFVEDRVVRVSVDTTEWLARTVEALGLTEGFEIAQRIDKALNLDWNGAFEELTRQDRVSKVNSGYLSDYGSGWIDLPGWIAYLLIAEGKPELLAGNQPASLS